MEVHPLKQQFYHSCLVTSLLMISQMTDQSMEERIFTEGEKRRFNYYLSGILESFVDNTMLSVELTVDNKFFAEELIKNQFKKNKRIKIKQEKVTVKLIKQLLLTQPLIINLDNKFLGDFSHSSHYVVVEKIIANGKLQLIDPLTGGKKILTEEKLEEAILSLKTHIKMCPLVIRKV